MGTHPADCLRVMGLLLGAALAVGCAQDGATTADLRPTMSPGSHSPAASTMRPTPAATVESSPIDRPGCPAPGSRLSFDELAGLDELCSETEVVVSGWWDRSRDARDETADLFRLVLREHLPAGDAEEGYVDGPSIPITELDWTWDTDGDELVGSWVDVRARVTSGDVCHWTIDPGAEQAFTRPPAWSCPRHLHVAAANAVEPPSDALAGCPDTARPMRVEDFVRFPRACFGTRTVAVAGWFDVLYQIGGWEDPWSPEPEWLWGAGIGRLPMLSSSSNPAAPDSLRVHVPPGLDTGRDENQWSILRGHYARESDYTQCRAVPDPGQTGHAGGRPTNEQAHAFCARAFVVEAVRKGEPG
jgi:hypothetical protein